MNYFENKAYTLHALHKRELRRKQPIYVKAGRRFKRVYDDS